MRVLIVEDEWLERTTLGKLLQTYYEEVITEILYAVNGQEAVALAQTQNPELIFMDIEMPVMDGLTAANRIRQENKQVQIIFLTAYSKFEYARQAIPLGVVDYIVKPYSVATLKTVMDQAIAIIQELYKEKIQSLNAEKVRTMLEREFMFKVMVNEGITKETISEYVSMLGVKQWYWFFLLRSRGGEKLENQIGDLVREKSIRVTKNFFTDTQCFLFFSPQKESLEEVFCSLQQEGMVSSEISSAWESCARVFHQQLRMIINHGKAIDMQELVLLEQQLGDAVMSRQTNQAITLGEEILRRAYRKYGTSNDYGSYIIQLYQMLLRDIYALDAGNARLLQEGLGVRFGTPYKGDVERAVAEFSLALEKIIDYLTINLKGKNHKLIQQVKDYIGMHYSEAISLDSIAETIGISRFYLSRCFKNSEGEGIKSYLTNYRIERAKQQLLSGQNVQEVAFQTGFTDPAYFSKCFKKVVGISPSEYQNM